MEISVREYFRRGAGVWESYLCWLSLPYLTEIRSVDAALNPRHGEPTILYPPDNDVVPIINLLTEIDTRQMKLTLRQS